MLKFLKKKKSQKGDSAEEAPAQPPQKGAPKPGDQPDGGTPPPPAKKKLITMKRVVLFLLVPVLLASAWVGYTRFFGKKAGPDDKPVYKARKMDHVKLPEEMLRFSFDRIPPLYEALAAFNNEITRLDKEIARIEAVGEKYPDQKKIVDTEKKVWEKTKNTLLKEFSKIDKPVKEMYVLFQVNRDQGLARVEEKAGELVTAAQAALAASKEQTAKLSQQEPPAPEGMIQGTLHKLKKKFL